MSAVCGAGAEGQGILRAARKRSGSSRPAKSDVDVLVIGSGLTGATIARLLRDNGFSVMVLERRSHPGGNVHDQRHASGIPVHTYGPHYFRTSSERIWRFVNRFSAFRPFAAQLKTVVDGRLEDWPVTAEYLERTLGAAWGPDFSGEPGDFEQATLAQMPRPIYEKFVRGYTEKQWGVPAASLSAGLAGRFEVRSGPDRRLKTSTFQGLPERGYAAFMQSLLRDIPVRTGIDYLRHRGEFTARALTVFTGAIDELFGFDLGRLRYRAQAREHLWLDGLPFKHPVVQVNYPSPASGRFVREIEWKHMMTSAEASRIAGTLITREYPYTPGDPDAFEYPFPDEANRLLYAKYAERAAAIEGLLVCGRLGEYRYYDMDQAIGRAMALVEKTISKKLGAGIERTAVASLTAAE
jgi:UDP-galactopyranose mutase